MSVVISIDIIACVLNKHQVSEGAFGTVPQTSRRGFYICSCKDFQKATFSVMAVHLASGSSIYLSLAALFLSLFSAEPIRC